MLLEKPGWQQTTSRPWTDSAHQQPQGKPSHENPSHQAPLAIFWWKGNRDHHSNLF